MDALSGASATGVRGDFYDRTAAYDLLWSYYTNNAYDSLSSAWNILQIKNNYYRHTRPIFNPTRRLVDMYAGAVWPGVLNAEPDDIPSHAQLAVPLPEKTPKQLRAAINQIWQWSNFSAQRYTMVRYGAALGNVMVEIIDDVDRGKVVYDIIWPSYVTDLELDYGGHVKAYSIEYKSEDFTTDKEFVYRRDVTAERISTFYDDRPYSYNGVPSSYANPYGFAPAVWTSHANIGNVFGMPALRNVTKIDELNSLVSHANDQIHKVLSAPIVLALHSPDAPLPDKKTEEVELNAVQSREAIDYIEANTDAQVHTISLPEGQALKHIQVLLDEVERDHPELSMWDKMRGMSQVSGIAVERLFGDASNYIREAQTNYDTSLIRLCQMSIAIAGMRRSEGAGGWSEDNYQRAKFDGYSLESYKDGELDFYILPRPMVPLTEQEAMQIKILRAQAERLEAEMNQPQQAVQPGQENRAEAVNLPNAVYGRLARLGTGPVPVNGATQMSTSITKESKSNGA